MSTASKFIKIKSCVVVDVYALIVLIMSALITQQLKWTFYIMSSPRLFACNKYFQRDPQKHFRRSIENAKHDDLRVLRMTASDFASLRRAEYLQRVKYDTAPLLAGFCMVDAFRDYRWSEWRKMMQLTIYNVSREATG
jgi:hypothetical protein